MGAEDGAVLKEGIEVLDELLHSVVYRPKLSSCLLLLVWSIAHPSPNRACHLVGLQVYPD